MILKLLRHEIEQGWQDYLEDLSFGRLCRKAEPGRELRLAVPPQAGDEFGGMPFHDS